jgi:O-antigen/teichoic acid export membrane protein
MLRKLLVDTAITAGAFLVATAIGLLVVPVLIGAYGLSGFGLIVLARVPLPAGAMGIVDFGIGEIATQAVSTARTLGDWGIARARLRVLACMTVAMVLVVGPSTFMLAMPASEWFKVPAEMRESFTALFQVTAIALPLLFAGILAEGVIRGFQKFSILRSAEVVLSLAYAVSVLLGVWLNRGYTFPAYAFLAMQLARSMIFILVAGRVLPHGPRAHADTAAIQGYVWERARLLFTARILGTMQHQAPTLLISLLVGPAAVGIYDTIVRLPKFAKSALAVMSSTLMPAVMRLDADGDHGRLQTIAGFTISVLPALIFPPIAAMAAFSGDVLNLWLGPEFVRYAPWLAAFLAIPALNTIISFQSSTLLNRPEYLRGNNRIAIVQTVLQLSLSLSLARWMAQDAFILGQVVATACVFVAQIRLGHACLRPPRQLSARFFAFVVLSGLVVAAFVAVTPEPVFRSLVGTLAALAVATGLMWAVSVGWFLRSDGRETLRRMFRVAFRRT